MCPSGHSFDIARQGHVALTVPRRRSPTGDTPEMVAARAAFLATGRYAPIIDAVVEAATRAVASWPALDDAAPPIVADLGAGTGHYLAAVLDALPLWRGVALDASRPALRHAARLHPRIAAVACDVWHELPLQDGSAALVLDVFSPRNGDEIARVLAPGGALVVVTPTPRHLHELVAAHGLLSVDADKPARLLATLGPQLRSVRRVAVEFEMRLEPDEARALIAMGPSAHHVAAVATAATGVVAVTASVLVETFRR